MLPRFYEVTQGNIRIDEMNITDITLSCLQSNIVIAQQDVYLFSGSIHENIAYDEIWEAAHRA
jgi:ATP-binding cassette, subfamily B, bacterial